MPDESDAAYAVLHLRFQLRVPPDVLLSLGHEAATNIASVEGLIWKVWLVDEKELAIGGMYLFASRTAAEAYLKHPVVRGLVSDPAVVSTQSQVWDVVTSLSSITRAPLRVVDVHRSEPYALGAGGQ